MTLDMPPINMPPGATVVFAALTGLTVGSFIAAASHRLASDGGARSQCRHCGRVLVPADLLPVLSFLFSRGRCRHCGDPIGWRYPAIELTAAALFVGVAVLRAPEMAPTWMSMVLVAGLLWAAVSDIEHGVIPDRVSIGVAVVGVIAAHDGGRLAAALVCGISALIGAWSLRVGYRRLRGRQGLGFGDVKLIGAAGLWLPADRWPMFLVIVGAAGLVTAALLGVGEGRSRSWPAVLSRRLPFAPAIGAGLILSLVLSPAISSH